MNYENYNSDTDDIMLDDNDVEEFERSERIIEENLWEK